MSLDQESILSFLLDRGGKVRNSELLSHFRGVILCGGSAEKQQNRDLFKTLVNSVAVVQQQDGVKFVVVKKRYQDFVGPCTTHTVSARSVREPNNSQRLKTNGNHCSTRAVRVHAETPPKRTRSMNETTTTTTTTTTVKVLNISKDQTSRTRTSGPVFAVIAVQSPPRGGAPPAEAHTHGSIIPHQRETTHTRDTVGTASKPVQQKDPGIESHCFTSSSKHTQTPQVRPPNKSTRHDVIESVPLEPLAHEWLLKCAAGLWGHIHALLLQDAGLAPRRDFMSGFTALHWAAKDGSIPMVHKLLNIPRRRGVHVDVNSKAHGGYTPVHIAAIHQQHDVMEVLVHSYGASVTERDHSGRKALHYLKEGVSAEIRAVLGGKQRKENIKEVEEQTKSFHISKLFHPHTGKRQKTAKFTQDQDW